MTRQAVQTKSFQIIADSGCNLPPWLIRRFKIFTVPTSYYSRRSPQNEELFDVNFGFDAQSFYARMKMGEDFVFNPLNASTCVRFIDPLIEETDDDVLF
ncbi:MAG: hypothetical protein FWE48_05105, partial [Coriobacteriia bacterium]|nr:hypothetical protein [Coriobacteriia bacterium]